MSLADDARWHAFITVCSAAAAANMVVWIATQALQSPTAGGLSALVSAAVAGSLAWALLRRSNAGGGLLTWDGAVWLWADDKVQSTLSGPMVGDVRVVIDFGTWMLLRFTAETPLLRHVVWLPASRRQAGASWPAWRAALFSRRAVAEPTMTNDPR